MFYCCGLTEKGLPDINEDSYLINRMVLSRAQMESDIRPPFVVAVADGVGGENGGEVASRMALEALAAYKPTAKQPIEKKIHEIHRMIREEGLKKGLANMQTTLAAIIADENGRFFAVNVGDSRIYRYRFGELTQLSKDQSLVQLLYDQGKISLEEKLTHKDRNLIFPAIGHLREDPSPFITEIKGGIKSGDLMILCSDGVSDHISVGDFEEILSWPMRLSRRLRHLVSSAADNGSPDNMTAVGLFLR